MSIPRVTTQTSTTPQLPGHTFKLVKVITTTKDNQGRDVHSLIVYLEHLVDGAPTRTRVANLTLQPSDTTEAAPQLAWQAYVERDHSQDA